MIRYGLEHQFESAGGDTVSDIGELRDRMDEVEARVAHLTVDSAATRLMAALADRDVADIRQAQRGHTRVLNALRETQVAQGRTLAEHGEILKAHSTTLASHGELLAQQGKLLAQQGKMLGAIIQHLGITVPDSDQVPPG